MFRRKKDSDPTSSEFVDPVSELASAQAKKGRPTPKRSEVEAKNKRPLVAADRSSAGRMDKEARRKQREQAYQAMATGDERHMPAQHAGAERRYIRDYVDARFSLGEFFLPVALIAMVASLFMTKNPYVSFAVVIFIYLGFGIVIVDAIIATRKMRKKMVAKWGPAGWPRGATMYAITRIFQLRRLRQPKPQVARGAYPK